MFDIPNYVTFPIELGVAILILIMDRRQRRQERQSNDRFIEQQKQFRRSEIRQRERFNNFVQESSKRQIMLLESIMATLDNERVDDFKSEVGSRYARELSDDMEDLDELLEKKSQSDHSNPELEADIESKIEEIESAKDFIKHFLPEDTIKQISNIAKSANSAYTSLRDLPETLKQHQKEQEGKIVLNLRDQRFEVDPSDEQEIQKIRDEVMSDYKADRSNFLETINRQVQETLEGVKEELQNNLPESDTATGKIVDAVKSSLIETMGLGNLMKRSRKKQEEQNDPSEDKSNSDSDEQN